VSDFSKVEPLKRIYPFQLGPWIKFRRERVGVPDLEFWLAVGDEITVSTGDDKIPRICFTILEVQDEFTYGNDPVTGD